MSKRTIPLVFWALPVCLGLFAGQLPAQDNTELLNRMKAMEDRIKALEAEVQSLKGAPTAPPAAIPSPPPPQPAPEPVVSEAQPVTLGGAGGAASKALNPDISVIGNFTGAAGYSANRPTPSLEMREVEVGLQEIIDPFARADVFLSFGEKGVDVEEAYMTFTALPAHLQLQVGKMRAAFGRVNTQHSHVLPWIDRPLMTQDLVGGEEGISDAGLSLSRSLPAPKGIFLEGVTQIFRGDSENTFQANRRNDVATVNHLHAYHDFSESTNIDIGGSYARGHSPFGTGTNQLVGADVTVRWKPLRRAIYQSFLARSEFTWAHTSVGSEDQQVRPFGFYVSADYQLARRWFIGGRFDRSQRGNCLPTSPETSFQCDFAPSSGLTASPALLQDTGGSLVLSYRPSEFSQIRGQLRRNRYGEGLTANELLFQFMFVIGAHGAHPF